LLADLKLCDFDPDERAVTPVSRNDRGFLLILSEIPRRMGISARLAPPPRRKLLNPCTDSTLPLVALSPAGIFGGHNRAGQAMRRDFLAGANVFLINLKGVLLFRRPRFA
jgi:hypothetical protein